MPVHRSTGADPRASGSDKEMDMSGNDNKLSLLLFRASLAMAAVVGPAGACEAAVIYDSVLRNCSSAAQIIGQGETHKDEHTFLNGTTGDWGAVSISHVDAFAGSGPVDAYSDQTSSV